MYIHSEKWQRHSYSASINFLILILFIIFSSYSALYFYYYLSYTLWFIVRSGSIAGARVEAFVAREEHGQQGQRGQ